MLNKRSKFFNGRYMGKLNNTQLVTELFCFETSLSLTYEISFIKTRIIVSEEIETTQLQTVFTGATVWFV